MSIGGAVMSGQRFSPEFKEEAVRQIVDRGYSVAEVSERLGVSAHSLYKEGKRPQSGVRLDLFFDPFVRQLLNRV